MYDIEGKQTSELLNRQAVGERGFQKTELREVSSIQSPLVETPTNEVTEPSAQFLMIPMGILVIAWVMSFFSRLDFRKTVGKNLDSIKRCPEVPCSSCRFFKNEPYLKCAVHPLKVGSVEALNCPDCWPLDSSKFHH